jgi:hypothetical protein
MHFCGVQLIAVLLKEGLFMNANVLFHTWFRNSTSIIERTAQWSVSMLYHNAECGEQEEAAVRGEGPGPVGPPWRTVAQRRKAGPEWHQTRP